MLAVNAVVLAFAWRHLPETRDFTAGGSRARDLAIASLGMLRQPAFAGFVVQAGVIYASFLTFISIAPYVMEHLGHSSTEYGLWYLCLAGGYFIGNWTVTRVVGRIGLRLLIVRGLTLQLASALVGAGLVLAGIWHPAAVFIPMGILGIGQGMALPNISASAVALAPRTAGAASSLLGFSQQIIGALAVQAMAVFPTDTPVPIYVFTVAIALLAWVSLYLLPPGEPRAAPAG